ncbi:MAG: tetratricopeptide repeat protein [Terriglobales bacterium]
MKVPSPEAAAATPGRSERLQDAGRIRYLRSTSEQSRCATRPSLAAKSGESPEKPDGTNAAVKTVQRQLRKICASATFHSAGRLRRFLEFVVQEQLAGRKEQLKEYVVGTAVFDKTSAFDPRTDPIVRVQARRLRGMLERYYREEAGTDELVIDLPKGGYAPVFRSRAVAATRSRWTLALANRNTVVVGTLADHSVAGNLGFFCRGLRQEILCSLAQIPELHVLADTAGAPSATEAPQAALLVAGSVRGTGETLRVILQIVDCASGCFVWSGSLDAKFNDPILTQKEAALTLATQVRARAGGGANALLRRRPLGNPAARNLYLQGRYHLGQRTEEGLSKAGDFFGRALLEDPQFAPAHSGYADAYSLLGHYGVLAPAEVWTKAASYAATAVVLDPDSAECQTTLAHVKACQDWDWSGAERQFRHALLLDPNYATAHHWYATSCLAPLGRLEEALDELRAAQSLDPISAIIARDLAFLHFYRREYDLALDQCDHTVELNPYFSPAFCTLGLIQEQRQDMEEATAAFQRAIHLSPTTPGMHAALGHLYALTHQRKLAQKTLRTLVQLSATRYVSPFFFASIHLALGQTDEGFRWLTRACEDRCFELLFLNLDPRFDTVRQDPRFNAVVTRLKLAPGAGAKRTRRAV